MLSHRIDLNVSNAPLAVVLEQIVRAGVPLVYSHDALAGYGSASCECAGLTVRDVLERLLPARGIAYRQTSSGEIVLSPASRRAPVQTGTVRGRIVEEAGTALAAVHVRIVDTDISALTDQGGNYTLRNVPAGQQRIRAERMGFEPLEQAVQVRDKETVTVNLVMRVVPVGLDPLAVKVTTGSLVATERRRISNSTVVIEAPEIERSGARNIRELLEARAPGVQSFTNSGQNGSGGYIHIRGASSFMQDQTPLVYVDGVPVDIGSSALNRRGLPNTETTAIDGAHVRLDEISMDQIERIEIVKGPAATTLYGTDAVNGVIQIFTKRGTSGEPRITARMEQGFARPNLGDSFVKGSPFADRVRGLFKDPRTQSYGALISGGFGDVTYTLGSTHDRHGGVVIGNDEQQTAIQASIRALPRQELFVELSASFVQRSYNTLDYRNIFRYADLDITSTVYNPPSLEAALKEGRRTETDVSRFYAAATVTYQPSPIWQNRVTLGVDQSYDRNEIVGVGQPAEGIVRERIQRDFRRWSARYLTTISYPQTGAVTSTFSAGVEGYRDEVERFRFRGLGLPSHQVTSFDQAETFRGGDGGFPTDQYTAVASVGFFAQEQLGLWDRLFLTGGIRVDGNSSFGDDFGLQVYPRAGVAYVIEPADWWTSKLRVAWGRAGKAPPPFAEDLTFSLSRHYRSAEPILLLNDPGNVELKPEVGTEIEVGIENYFMGNRGLLELNVFQQETRDAILRAPISPISGFLRGPLANLGGLRSRGLELSARATPVDGPNTTVSVGLTLTHLFENGVVTDLGDYGVLKVGEQGSAWWVLDGIQEGGSIHDLIYWSIFSPTASSLDAYRVSAGSRVPLTYGGVNLDLRVLKDLQIYGNLAYGLGGHGFDYVRAARDQLAGFISASNRLYPPVAEARYIFKTDFFKLQTLRVVYRLPPGLARHLGDDVGVWVEGHNLLSLDHFDAGDPTTVPFDGYRAEIIGALDYTVPRPRWYGMGIEVTF